MTIELPGADGSLVPHTMGEPRGYPRPAGASRSRVAYAAAPAVPDPSGDSLDATLAFGRRLWSYGLRVDEAMDTAQRGMGLDWAVTRELIEPPSTQEALSIASSAGRSAEAPDTRGSPVEAMWRRGLW